LLPFPERGEDGGEVRGLSGPIIAAILARFVLNVGFRMAYPFLPQIRDGLGVPLYQTQLLLTARSATGLANPLFGPLSDRYGRRSLILIGMVLFVLGMALCAVVPVYAVFLMGFVLVGFAKTLFDPGLQAYLGDRVPYHRRGRVIAATELAWSLALLIGAPLVGLAINALGWRSPFWMLALLGIGTLGLVRLMISAQTDHALRQGPRTSHRGRFATVWREPGAVIAALVYFLMMFANENLFISYGPWMEQSFRLSTVELGIATSVIGVAELAAELLTGAVTDVLGKKRAVAIGLVITAISYVILPFTGAQRDVALAGLFLLFISFEFTVVSGLPLITELVPGARGTMLSVNIAAMSLGRMAGAVTGATVWAAGGFGWVGLISGLASLVTLVLWLGYVRERGPGESPAVTFEV
jgi:predicted MFS family arabinose efflux permease